MVDVVSGNAASRGVASYIVGLASYTRSQVLTVPNAITALRFAAAIYIMVWPDNRTVVFKAVLFAAVTDLIDGWLARLLNQATDLGKKFDQLTDKVYGLALFYPMLLWEGFTWYNTPAMAAIVVYSCIVTYWRARRLTTNTSDVAKWKTALQFIACILVIGSHAYVMPFIMVLGYGLLWYSLWPTWKSFQGYAKEVFF